MVLSMNKGAAPPNAAPHVEKRGAVKTFPSFHFAARRGSVAPPMISSKVYLFLPQRGAAQRCVRWGRTY